LDKDYQHFWIRNGRAAKNFGDTFKQVQLKYSDRAPMTLSQWRHWSFQTNAMWRSHMLDDLGLAEMRNLSKEINFGAETAGHTVDVEWETYRADPLLRGGALRDWKSREVHLRWHLLHGWEPRLQPVPGQPPLRPRTSLTTQASNDPITPSRAPQQPAVSLYVREALDSLRSCFGFDAFRSGYQQTAASAVCAALDHRPSPVVQLALGTNAGKTAAVLGPTLARGPCRLVLYIVHPDVLVTDLLTRLHCIIPSAFQTAFPGDQARPSPRFARVRPAEFSQLSQELAASGVGISRALICRTLWCWPARLKAC
jgi:hypothetical protein